MNKIAVIVTAIVLSGCSFAPPDAYPIFRLPSAEQAAKLQQATASNSSIFSAASTISEAQERLQGQQLWYLHLAENTQTAVYNQSDWATGGAVLGTLGGLAKSVPAAATGALVGGGSSLIASRYSLNGQTNAYLKAAEKSGCIWAVVTSYASVRKDALPEAWKYSDNNITKAANLGSLQIQMELRRTLLTLSPPVPETGQLLTLYNDYGKLKKDAFTTASLANQPGAKRWGATVPTNSILVQEVKRLKESVEKLKAKRDDLRIKAEKAAADDKSIAESVLKAATKALQSEQEKLANAEKRLRESTFATVDNNNALETGATAAEAAAEAAAATAQEKVTDLEIRSCVITGTPPPREVNQEQSNG